MRARSTRGCDGAGVDEAALLCLERSEAVGHSFNVGNPRSAVTIYDLAQRVGTRAGPDIADLVHSYRELGHLVADLDPLGGSPREHPLLRLSELGFSEDEIPMLARIAFEDPQTIGNPREVDVAGYEEIYRNAFSRGRP